MSSSSPAVRYEAAGTLATLSNTPTAIKSVGECYIDLIVTESDNNVKLIVLDRLNNLCARVSNRRILQNIVMDLLRTLEAPDIEVRRRTLDLVFILITIKSANEVRYTYYVLYITELPYEVNFRSHRISMIFTGFPHVLIPIS